MSENNDKLVKSGLVGFNHACLAGFKSLSWLADSIRLYDFGDVEVDFELIF